MAYYETYIPNESGELQRVVINAGVGFCLPYYGTEAPPGTLACDGSEISREAYKELFAVLGTKAGAGDGVSTFNLPDFRGRFIRGTGGNAAALGVQQGDAIRNIIGDMEDFLYRGYPQAVGPHANGALYVDLDNEGARYGVSASVTAQTGDLVILDVSRVVPTAAENRPVNVALLWCIIYE